MERICEVESCDNPAITGRAVQQIQPTQGGDYHLTPKSRWGHQVCSDHLMLKWKAGDPLPKFKEMS